MKTTDRKKLKLLRDGKLKITESNSAWVKKSYIEAVQWNSLFDGAGLGGMEDPEREFDEPMYEAWLESAFRGNFETDEQCKQAIQSVRSRVLEINEATNR